MGGLFKQKVTSTKQPFETNPWKPQQDSLKTGFNAAAGALTGAISNNDQIGDFTADMNQGQTDAIGAITATGNGAAQDLGALGMAQGGAIGNIGGAANNANDIYARAGTDRTAAIQANGASYADNPYLQGQIDSAMSDVNRGFNRDVAGINGAASLSGNINSTRAGAMEARALDDAMDRGASIAGGMRSAAYEGGMDRAIGQDAMSMDQLMNANAQVGATGQTALSSAAQGLGITQAGSQDALNAQGMLQSQAQNEIAGQREMSKEEMDLIQRYMATIGGNYGSNGFQTNVSVGQSPFQTLVGGAAAVAGMGGFGK